MRKHKQYTPPGLTLPRKRGGIGLVLFGPIRNLQFAPDGDYRLGFGSIKQGRPQEADRVKEAQLLLEKSGKVVEAKLVDFDQAYTKTWWEEVEQLKMQGFVFGTAPPEGQKLTLRVKVPRKVAESLEAVYIGVSRDYGGGLWYLVTCPHERVHPLS